MLGYGAESGVFKSGLRQPVTGKLSLSAKYFFRIREG